MKTFVIVALLASLLACGSEYVPPTPPSTIETPVPTPPAPNDPTDSPKESIITIGDSVSDAGPSTSTPPDSGTSDTTDSGTEATDVDGASPEDTSDSGTY